MKTARKISPIAIAVLTLCAAPLAFAYGDGGSVSAGVSGSQLSTMNSQFSAFGSTNGAALDGNAGRNLSGNAGFNIASGSQNQQDNSAALASSKNRGQESANASVGAGQVAYWNLAYQILDGSNSADFSGNALRGASGNIGVNIAAGFLNQQRNSMALSRAKHAETSYASAGNGQTMAGTFGLSLMNTASGSSNDTTLSGNAMRDTSGNIGVNEASGIGNQQGNTLAVAIVNHGNKWSSAGAYAETGTGQSMYGNGSGQAGTLAESEKTEKFTLTRESNNVRLGGGNVLRNASGNIGVNLASGLNNQQANSLAVSVNQNRHSHYYGMAAASAGAAQTMIYNGTVDLGVQDTAALSGNTARGAAGNIGLNVASGAQNQQQNGLAIASLASRGAMGSACAPIEQSAFENVSMTMGSSYSASVSSNTLRNATGNIGLNVAAGNNNQQANTLAISSVR